VLLIKNSNVRTIRVNAELLIWNLWRKHYISALLCGHPVGFASPSVYWLQIIQRRTIQRMSEIIATVLVWTSFRWLNSLIQAVLHSRIMHQMCYAFYAPITELRPIYCATEKVWYKRQTKYK